MRTRNMLKLLLITAVALSLTLGLTQAQQPNVPRFDHLVREDFFAGFAGDAAALARGMARCENQLKEDPNHAEALVWHGAGLEFQAVAYFQKGEFQKGNDIFQQGEKEMERAVQLQPKSVSILVPRAAHYVVYSRYVPDKVQQRVMLEKVIHDYEEVYRQQQSNFARLSIHARGELLLGMAEAYLRLGGADNRSKAAILLQQARKESGYTKEADAWLQAAPDAKPATFFHTCVGCHAG
ncbi:MAG: hypothetical protein U0Y68_17880 [Blastocatellia bacterium]